MNLKHGCRIFSGAKQSLNGVMTPCFSLLLIVSISFFSLYFAMPDETEIGMSTMT